jgi:hypothetical protein
MGALKHFLINFVKYHFKSIWQWIIKHFIHHFKLIPLLVSSRVNSYISLLIHYVLAVMLVYCLHVVSWN